MPGYQNTFTLITERVAPVTDEPARPMTSKQVKKAHKAANKAPKISRAEQRKLELAEQERIRKELERDRQANRARHAREKKKAKEDSEKDERRKKGRPLVDVRPSQDTIARFVKGNGWGRKRDGAGAEVAEMAPVIEEGPETEDHAEVENEDVAIPVPAPEPEEQVEVERGDHRETAIIPEPEPGSQCSPEVENEPGVETQADSEAENIPGPQPQDNTEPSGLNEGEEHGLEGSQAHIVSAKEPQRSGQRSFENHGSGNTRSQVALSRVRTCSSLPPSSNHQGQQLGTEEPVGPRLPVTVSATQAFWDDGLDDDSMQELEVVEEQSANWGKPGHAPEKKDQNVLLHAAGPRATQRSLGTQRTDYGGLEDVFAGIGTQAVGLWEMEDEDSLLAEQPLPSLRQPEQDTAPIMDPVPDEIINEDEDALEALEALGAVFERNSSPEPVCQPWALWKADKRTNLPSRQLKNEKPPPPAPTPKELSSFTEDGLDDDLLQQLDIELQLEGNATVNPVSTTKSTPNVEQQPQGVSPQASPDVSDLELDRLMPPPPVPKQPPMSTQAVLTNLDDYFPSPSQQERELDDDLGGFLKTQPTPCPPPKRPRPQQQTKPPTPSPLEQPKSQKRFFSASGSNELLSLAIHRSKRDAAMNDLHRKDQQRFEAGRAQAKQAAQQGRQFMPQRQNAMRPLNTQSGRQPRPAGKPPAWVTNENIEPPPKRQKITRTKSQVRPPAFKQPTANMSRTSPKPPAFKPMTKPPPQSGGKENQQDELVPMASQGSDYGGDWVDEMAMDMASAGRGCLSATQITMDRGNGRWIR